MAWLKVLLVLSALVGYIHCQNQVVNVDYGEIPRYSFAYQVDDPQTGDSKAQEEVREGDNVRGFYTLIEADGSLRRVDYTADEQNGFRATVSRTAGAARPPAVNVARTVVVRPQPVITVSPRPVVRTVVRTPVRVAQQPIITSVPQYITSSVAQPHIITTGIAQPQYISGFSRPASSSLSYSVVSPDSYIYH